jgi:hypothetical protein
LLFNLGIDPLQQVLDLATSHGLLHKVRGRGPILRTSLYADDAAIFLAPIREDIQTLLVYSRRLVRSPVSAPTSKRAPSFLSVAMIFLWTIFLRVYRFVDKISR